MVKIKPKRAYKKRVIAEQIEHPSSNGAPANKKRYQSRGISAEVAEDIRNNGKFFEIEKEPPPILFRFQSPEVQALRDKLKATAEHTRLGEAFIIPKVVMSHAKSYLLKAHPEHTYRFVNVIGNDKVVRVYKTNPVNKGWNRSGGENRKKK